MARSRATQLYRSLLHSHRTGISLQLHHFSIPPFLPCIAPPSHPPFSDKTTAAPSSPLPNSPLILKNLSPRSLITRPPSSSSTRLAQLSLFRRSFHSTLSPFSDAQSKKSEDSTQGLLEEGANQTPRPPRQPRRGPVTWGSLALLIVTGLGLLWYFEEEKKRRMEDVKKVKSVGKAAIGGPIELIDIDGKLVTESEFKGKWNLLYFGFTYCPDICPAELEKMAAAIDLLEKKHGLIVQPIFISIDPERDTPEQVKAYVKEFHPKMVGLTGTVDSVKSAAREFRVYYMKTEEEGDDYLVDHSIIMYLMDPKWEFVKFFGKNHSPESLVDGIANEILSWSTEQKALLQ